MAAARRQQAAYRTLGRHPEWDPITRPRIPPSLLEIYDRNVDARRQLTAINKGRAKDTLPAWRIDPPTPTDELLGYYREAESASGVGWTYLAAINLIETCFGRIAGVSTAGAQGPMQFLPSTFAAYGEGGVILSPHDSIMAAGRYLAVRQGRRPGARGRMPAAAARGRMPVAPARAGAWSLWRSLSLWLTAWSTLSSRRVRHDRDDEKRRGAPNRTDARDSRPQHGGVDTVVAQCVHFPAIA